MLELQTDVLSSLVIASIIITLSWIDEVTLGLIIKEEELRAHV